MTDKTSLSYKDAGVDIDAGNALVERIKGVSKRTRRPEVLGGLGGFGALCQIPAGYKEPVLVSGTDGVGTKLRLAIDLKKHDTVGIDLVAMSVNDVLVQGVRGAGVVCVGVVVAIDVGVRLDGWCAHCATTHHHGQLVRTQAHALTQGLQGPSRGEADCIQYDLHRDAEQARTFHMIEQWRDESAHTAHEATPHFQAALPYIEHAAEKLTITKMYRIS